MPQPKYNYYDIKPILSTNSSYYVIYGGRGNGKSYQVKNYIINEWLKDRENNRFIYLRRQKEDVDPTNVYGWFADFTKGKNNLIKKLTKNEFNGIYYKSGIIYMAYYDDNQEIKKKEQFGYSMSLYAAERYKSQSYLDVNYIVFEEFIPTGSYISKEISKFESIISTVARSRKITIFMIANSIVRDNEYFNYFGITQQCIKQEKGTINIFEFETGHTDLTGKPITVKFAVEFSLSFEDLNSGSKVPDSIFAMFTKKSSEHIISGQWYSEKQPTLDNASDFRTIYTIVVEHNTFKYLCELKLSQNGDVFWYVTPKTSEIQPRTRVISNIINISSYYSNNLKGSTPQEAKVFNLFKEGKVFYANDLTGTEFKKILPEYF